MILLVDCGSRKVPFFEEIFKECKHAYTKLGMAELPNCTFDKISKVIISGAPILLTQESPQKYMRFFAPVWQAKLPVLGVCFGHQIMGLAFGAKVTRCIEARADQLVHLSMQEGIFKGFKRVEVFNEDHCECISLPTNFKRTAYSEICEVEAMQHVSLPFYGVQFHPETSGANGVELVQNFINLC